MKIVIASTNTGKIREYQEAFKDLEIKVVSLAEFFPDKIPEIEETGKTFKENALLKAKAYAEMIGEICLADDSGLTVDCLNGKPGLFSHRFAVSPFNQDPDDNERNHVLLCLMQNNGFTLSNAQYHCAISLYNPNTQKDYTIKEICHGMIKNKPHGTNGFSFDPIFYLSEYNFQKTMADISLKEKNKISHRGKAISKIKDFLSQIERNR